MNKWTNEQMNKWTNEQINKNKKKNQGICINIGGGYHHAHSDGGGGFCVFADITLAIQHLRKDYAHNIKVMIVDLDAHQVKIYCVP